VYIGYVDIAGRSPAMGRQTSARWGMRQNHSHYHSRAWYRYGFSLKN